MKLKIQFINAFTSTLFHGNSAAVIVIEQWLDKKVMQSIATENNLSETAFVKPVDVNSFEIRWFSPITEIDFCGHATLAAAFVLYSLDKSLTAITFVAKAVGNLLVIERPDGFIQMSFPNRTPREVVSIPDALINGLSIPPCAVLKNEQAFFAIYSNEQAVKDVVTNDELLKKLAPLDVVVTAPSLQYDFISRYFWPANGGIEDPVTGSIHAGLAPYWSAELDKDDLIAYQASERGGMLKCTIEHDRVLVSGQAVKYLEGIISI